MITSSTILFYLIPFYLLGAFPTGRIIAKLAKVDLSSQGSGSVGATNVARVLGKKAGLLTLLCDTLKGFLAAFLAEILYGDSTFTPLAGATAVFGHCLSLPPFIKGGKGVATALGVVLFVAPSSALIGVCVFLIVFLSTKIVSLGSLIAAVIMPLTLYQQDLSLQITVYLISLLVIIRHKDNLIRLWHGQESQFKIRSNKN